MMWGGVSLIGKMRPIIIGVSLNAERYPEEKPYLHSVGLNSALYPDNTHPYRAWFIRDYLQGLGVKRMERPASSPDINPMEQLWDQLVLFVKK